MSGIREFTFMISNTGLMGLPPSTIFMAGSLSPSWKISVASPVSDPGAIPPTSELCAIFAVHAMMRPSANTGIAITMSFKCVTPPQYGSFVANTSPGATSPGLSNFAMSTLTALSRTPMNAGMPAPDDASSPFAFITPVPMSRTS